jgi:aminomethyltransferase
MTDQAKNIPLQAFHQQHGARFVNFGGWNMPVQYTSILEEHRVVRQKAGLFDVSHMGEFFLGGSEAATFLDRLLVNRTGQLPVGKAIYSPMCDATGGVIDDLIVYCLAQDHYLICVNASNREKDYAWMQDRIQAWKLSVELNDRSDDYALLALQGPLAAKILTDLGWSVSGLKRFWHQVFNFQGESVRVCRTGYTGEDGFELYSSPAVAEQLASKLLECGQPSGLQLCGLGARDSLRLEAGLPLYGHELSENISPLMAGLAWTVKFDKADDFMGKSALANQKEEGLSQQVVHFTLEGKRIAREGTPIRSADGQTVGSVLSGSYSPTCDCPIGSALIDVDALKQTLTVDLRKHSAQLRLKKAPLYK